MPQHKRPLLLLLAAALLTGSILFAPSPGFSAVHQYLYHPTYYPTIEEAYAAI